MVFSLANFKAETNNFQTQSRRQRHGLALSIPGYATYLLGREFWKWLFQARLSDENDNLNPLFAVPPAIKAEHLKDCRVFANRLEMISSIPAGLIWAEVGTYEGEFAQEIERRCAPRRLHLFDLDFRRVREKAHVTETDTVRFHTGNSFEKLATFSDDYFDVIYIDADHSLLGVARDVHAAIPKLKPGGLLIFNDYIYCSPLEIFFYGTVPVVNAVCQERGWQMMGMALHPKMYCDVMLRKPL